MSTTGTLTGTGSLVRLALRRDRVMLAVWILVFVVMAAGSASATVGLFGTQESRIQAAASINNSPSLVALYGLIYDESSVGALSMIKLGAFGGALVAVLAILLVIRHTRAEEEAGRLELVGSTAVGRHAPLAAAILVTVAANLVLGLLTALGLIGAGLSATGSFAFGLAWASVGIAFTAIAAVTAQMTQSARAATGLALAVLGAVYVLRAIGDTADGESAQWLRWLSPIGWGQQVRPYQGDRWVVLLLPAVFFALLTALAYVLVERRDHGAGLLPDRPGPATAARTLGTPLGLAWRLHRGAFYGWLAAFVLIGLVFGNVAANVGGFMSSEGARNLIEKLGGVRGLTDAFLSTELGMAGVIASVYAVQVVMRMRSEEAELRSEPVLATAVGRISWAGSHIAVALAGTTALLLAGGLGAGLTYASQTGQAADIWRTVAAAAVRVPATWVMAGIAVAVFGLAPRAVVVGWAALVAFLLLGEFGPLFTLDQWVMDLSPYAHVPRLPGGELSAAPLVWLAAVAALLVTAGLAGLRRRDIPVS
jgi:ABC-2 type transport system permease protein